MDWEGLGAVRSYVSEAIQRAAEEIRERGWVQGRFVHEESGAIDVVQALGLASGIDVADSHKRDIRLPAGSCILLGAALQEVKHRLNVTNLAVWNDLPENTSDSVVDMLEDTARALARA